MMVKPSDSDLCQALLKFVTDGTFPESEDVVSAELAPKATSHGLETITTARQEVEHEICSLSRETAPDIDGWISQAKRLHEDIERSRITARDIVVQHEKGLQFRSRVGEAEQKVQELQNEIALSQTLSETFQEAHALNHQLASAREALNSDQHHRAFEILQELESSLKTNRIPPNSHIFRILSSKSSDLRSSIRGSLRRQWDRFTQIDHTARQITIAVDDSGSAPEIEKLLSNLTDLELFDVVVDSFQEDFLSSILNPILATGEKERRILSVEGNTLSLKPHHSSLQVSDILDAIVAAFRYLREHLPSTIIDRLSLNLFPAFSSELIARWITPAVPIDITCMHSLEQLVEQVTKFEEILRNENWRGVEDVQSWIGQVPRLWLNRRRAQSLDEVRTTIINCNAKTSTVERVEKEKISKNDGVFGENGADEDWDAGWASDNENDESAAKAETQNDDEDVSAWGLEDDVDIPDAADKDASADDDIDEAWGWGEDNDDNPSTEPVESSSHRVEQGSTESLPQREMTLKEFYEVTDIPISVLSIVAGQVSDGEFLTNPANANMKIAASGAALFALPTLVIAMFKATATLFYPQKFTGGQMLLYNDSMYLAEQLQAFLEQHSISKLKSDIESVERFGRIAYGKEMHSQRTILTDLLDGCQGFESCAAQPFQAECESAVASTVDRLRDVYKEWKPILSRSALLQSIGSLLSTVLDKVIIDIEDLSDISDAESQRLVGFFNSISKLEDLFLADRAFDDGAGNAAEPIPMTAMYVSNWLKFQYLINILEGSLADIKYLWIEGSLKLEFSQEEVLDLIKALFADSDHRKRAMAEIRGSSSVS